MEKEYFVMYHRDKNGEESKDIMIYDRVKEFRNRETAISFGLSHLQEMPLIAKKIQSLSDYNPDTQYLVAAYFESKYSHTWYDDSSDPIPTHEVIRCNQNNLDTTVERLASQTPKKMYLGIEEKLIPSALDRIRSVNRQ